MLIRRLYQALRPPRRAEAPPIETPFHLEALEEQVAPILGIGPEQLARRRVLDAKRRELADMEDALQLKERERAAGRARPSLRMKHG